jgi:DNA-binding CsgD family transcriptional regulator
MANLKNPDHLSEIEIKVMLATCNGLSNSEIARIISKSQRMVERCRKNLYNKFYVRNKEELVKVAGKLFRLNFN